MPRLRYQDPDRLPGATEYSKTDELRGSLNAVRLVKSQPWVWDGLRNACELEVKYARKREPGHWELAAVAFGSSKQIHIQGWYDETTDELWRECGFKKKPSYPTAHRRLRELENVCDEFLTAAALLIRRCREHDPRVMAHVHFDFSEDETHAGLQHDCQPTEACKHPKRVGRRPPGSGLRLQRAGTDVAREKREEWNTEAPDESDKHAKEAEPEKVQFITRDGKKIKRIHINGCWYRTRDTEAGIRAYGSNGKTKRFWHGYYGGKAIDHFTGGVIPSVDSASRQECHIFPELYDRVKDMVGEAPETAIGDRGLSVKSCFEHATKNGTAPIFPWRQPGGGHPQRHDKETHDRHGVARCKHCGGPTKQIRFAVEKGNPRLWFRCEDGTNTPACAKPQSIYCSQDWRTLVPLERTTPLYHELRESHQTYEGVHQYWKNRYKICSDSVGVRNRVVSIDWHRLRANVACLIDWLRIAKKNDWLGPVCPKQGRKRGSKKVGERRFKKRGEDHASNLTKMRVRMGLSEPYGPKAAKLGIGRPTIPSQRPPNRLKNQIALDLPGP